MAAPSQVSADPQRDAEFDQAFELLAPLVDLRQADQLMPLGPAAVYTASVVLWLLVYQRLNRNASLQAAVTHLVESAPHLCPDNKRVRNGSLSRSTGSYSDARQRLTLEVAEWFCDEVSRSIIAAAPPTLNDRRVFLVDGTNLTLAPEPKLRTDFPPARNQYGEGVWPLVNMVVLHELESGCAVRPEIGPKSTSEVELAKVALARLPEHSVIMADSNFGIFSMAYKTIETGHSFVFRMTESRFNALRRQAVVVDQGAYATTYRAQWTPSRKDRQTNPDLPAASRVEVFLHEIEVHEKLTLWLVTDLTEDAWTLSELYERRVNVEVDIRNIKVVLESEQIRARDVEMFRKELLTSMVAYNLVVQFRRQAAELAKVPPRRLSFTGVWTTYREFLLLHWETTADAWRARYRRALGYAMEDKLPNRPGRSFERAAYRKRPKSTHFAKRKPPPPKEPPPQNTK